MLVRLLCVESGYLHKAVLLEGEAHIIEEIQVLKQPQHVTNLLISVSKVPPGSEGSLLTEPHSIQTGCRQEECVCVCVSVTVCFFLSCSGCSVCGLL